MKPRGPLMMEHRNIEKIIEVIEQQITMIRNENILYSDILDTIIDFFKVYADKTHHGKEEDILFKKLNKKELKNEDKTLLNELTKEHKIGRKIVSDLSELKAKYMNKKTKKNINKISDKLRSFIDLYPQHIDKEDNIFFPNAEKYFNQKEQDEIIEEFKEFDKNMIHEKYKMIIKTAKEKFKHLP